MAAVQVLQHQRQPLASVDENVARLQSLTSAAAQNQALYADVPTVVHANEQKALKSEDMIYVRRAEAGPGDCHSIFMVCDGHQGPGAASHCVEHLPGLLGQLMPQQLPNWQNMGEVVQFSEKVRRAISSAAVLLDNDWARQNGFAGTTMTLAVVSGWLLTVANTGDSNAIIDTGDVVQEITLSHRIQVNKGEQNRLRQNGVQLAPLGFHLQGPAKPQEMGVGPLRLWPGGLCVSRSIGDLDAGPLIVPLPHVRQVLLTRRRALRLIVASDGLWDLVSFTKAAKSVRHKLPHQAVSTLVQMVAKDRRMADDVSIIIVDVLPPPAVGVVPQQFPASALQATTGSSGSNGSNGSIGSGKSSRSGSGGLFSCFKGPQVIESVEPAAPAAAAAATPAAAAGSGGATDRPWTGLEFFADVDCYEAYPVHGQNLARSSMQLQRQIPVKGDFTVHGGHVHKFQQDSSWHTGESQHGSSNLPMFLSQQQLEQLQADGPAAAASMTLSGQQYNNSQQQQQQPSPSLAAVTAAAGTGPSGSGSSSSGGSCIFEQRQHGRGQLGSSAGSSAAKGGVGSAAAAAAAAGRRSSLDIADPAAVRLLMGSDSGVSAAAAGSSSSSSSTNVIDFRGRQTAAAYNSRSSAVAAAGTPPIPAAAAAATGGSRSSSSRGAVGPSSPAPGALIRSASAEFESDGSGVFVAAHETADSRIVQPGRVIGVPPAALAAADKSHYGSAPIMGAGGGGGGGGKGAGSGGSGHSPGGLAAAAAEEEEEQGLRALGVRSALLNLYDEDHQVHQHGHI